MPNKYDLSCYDKYVCLKPNLAMWLIFLFFLKPYLVFVASVVNRSDRMMLINLFYPDQVMLSLGALVSIPAALVVFAWTRKKPDSGDFIKAVWLRGRNLLTMSAVLNACIVFVPHILGMANKVPPRDWIQLALSLLIIVVLNFSVYIRDCFRDYPEPESKAASSGHSAR